MGTMGGGKSTNALLALGPGDWNWIQDARVMYFDKHKNSPYNDKPGTYVQIEGDRYNLTQYPGMPDGPPVPDTKSRTP